MPWDGIDLLCDVFKIGALNYLLYVGQATNESKLLVPFCFDKLRTAKSCEVFAPV